MRDKQAAQYSGNKACYSKLKLRIPSEDHRNKEVMTPLQQRSQSPFNNILSHAPNQQILSNYKSRHSNSAFSNKRGSGL